MFEDIDYLSAGKGMRDLTRYSLNKIENHIRKGERNKAFKALQKYVVLRDALSSFNFYDKAFDDKFRRLEISARELPKLFWDGNGKEPHAYDFLNYLEDD